MIVCHCNVITEREIRDTVDGLLDEMPLRVITPGLVYRELGKRGRCCGCFPLAIDIINRHIEAKIAACPTGAGEALVEEQRGFCDAYRATRAAAVGA